MKIKGILFATVSLLGFTSAFAQVEYDDMYFNSEDRAALKARQSSTELAYNTPNKDRSRWNENEEERVNPTDTYSARTINPEYAAREHTKEAQIDEEDYFVENYQYNRNQLNNWNNNFNSWYNDSWYRNNYYGPGINTWNSPYYGYNTWNSPWYDPYWSYNGWSTAFSFHYGSRWNYGWGGAYNYWNRPYYGFNAPYYAWDPMYGAGWYGGGYWNNYRYPNVVILNRGERSNVVYGKRPTRGSTVIQDRNYVRSRGTVPNAIRTDDSNSSGRVSTQGRTKQEEYYNRYNRRSTSSPSSSYGDRSNTQNNRSRSWDSWNNNSSPTYNRSQSSSPSYSPSRSTSSPASRPSSGSGSSGRRGRD